MKRFISIFMALLLLAMPLTACKNKPAGDESGAPAKDDNKSAQYDTLANIKANTPATFKKEMDNIVFDGQVITPDTDKCYDLTFKISTEGYYDHYNEYRDLFIDNYSPEFEQGTDGDYYYRSEHQAIGSSKLNGAFFYQNMDFALKDAENNTVAKKHVEKTQFYRGETPSDTEYVMLDGTKLSMKKAAQQTQEFIDTFLKKYEPDFAFVIRSGYVSQREGCDYYTIEFLIANTYEGMSIDSKAYISKCNEAVGNVTRFDRYSNVWIPSANGFKTWTIQSDGRICKVTDKKTLDDKFITFESALELLRREITSLGDMTLDCAEFCYVMYYEGYAPEGAKEFEKVSEYHAHPMWTFTSIIPYDEVPQETQQGNGEMRRIYTVDAITGAVAVYYDIVGRGI